MKILERQNWSVAHPVIPKQYLSLSDLKLYFWCSGVVTVSGLRHFLNNTNIIYIYLVWYSHTFERQNMMNTKAWKATWKCHSLSFNSKHIGHSIRTKTLPERYKHHIYILCDVFIHLEDKIWCIHTLGRQYGSVTRRISTPNVSPPCSLRTKILIKNGIRRCVGRKIRMRAISFCSTQCSNTSLWTYIPHTFLPSTALTALRRNYGVSGIYTP